MSLRIRTTGSTRAQTLRRRVKEGHIFIFSTPLRLGARYFVLIAV
jgi:hypothetical protein